MSLSEKIISQNKWLVGVQQKYMKRMDEILQDKDERYVSVVVGRCGIGKSLQLKYYIRNLAQKNMGAIIITDSVARLESYVERMPNEREKQYCNFLNRTIILKNEDIAMRMNMSNEKPVLLMTTQRYFNMTTKERETMLTYKNGIRKQIIFDEKPNLCEQIEISMTTLNNILSALQDGIDDEQKLKNWCVNQFKALSKKIEKQLMEYEKMGENQFYLWHEPFGNMTADDSIFMDFIDSHKREINRFQPDTYKYILALKQLVYEGAIFEAKKRKTGEYGKAFIIMLDHRKELVNIGAKVFILDATADLSLEYDNEYFKMVAEVGEFDVPLNNLQIDIVNVSTSKNTFCRKTKKAMTASKAIDNYINEHTANKRTAIFTYKEAEKKFRNYNTVGHFGNLKGFNDYRECDCVVQIGLNRFPQLYYYQIQTLNGTTNLDEIKKLSHEEQIKRFSETIMNQSKGERTDYKVSFFLLADLEQNIFRSAIRNINFVEKIHIILFFNTTEYEKLIELIEFRYGNLGATINVVNAPKEIVREKSINRVTKKPTISQRINDWKKEQPIGRVFAISEMLSEVGITQNQFNDVKKENNGVKEEFKAMSVGMKRGYYKV
ncbi:MAG: hypothetical protein ACI4SR_04135 [Faecalibacillus sp.]